MILDEIGKLKQASDVQASKVVQALLREVGNSFLRASATGQEVEAIVVHQDPVSGIVQQQQTQPNTEPGLQKYFLKDTKIINTVAKVWEEYKNNIKPLNEEDKKLTKKKGQVQFWRIKSDQQNKLYSRRKRLWDLIEEALAHVKLKKRYQRRGRNWEADR